MMDDPIKREDALAACDIAPPDEWNDYTKGGYDFAAEECKRNIATLPAIDPAAIREAALREAYGVLQNWVYCCDAEDEILALIGEKK